MKLSVFTPVFIMLSAILAALSISSEGLPSRISEDRLHPSPSEFRAEENRLCGGVEARFGGDPGDPLLTCSYDIGAPESIYVWGDSHARHLISGLVARYPAHNIQIFYFTSCPSQSGLSDYVYDYEGRAALQDACVARNKAAIDFFASAAPTAVILHQYFGYAGQFTQEWYTATSTLMQELTQYGHSVVFIGGVVQPKSVLSECLAVPAFFSDKMLEARCKASEESYLQISNWNSNVAARFPDHFLDVTSVFCADGFPCASKTGPQLLFRDDHHLSIAGSRFLINALAPTLNQKLGLK